MTKPILLVTAALVLGMLMPYLSRVPLSFTYGTPWIWNYISSSDDFLRWNGFHIFSLIPMFLFGLLYIFAGFRFAFLASVLGHFAATVFIYCDFGVRHGPDNFLGCLLFPPMFAFASFVAGSVGLVVGMIIQKKKEKNINDIA